MHTYTVLVEVNSRRLGGSMMLLPFEDAWLASNTCRELLPRVLVINLDRPTALVITEHIKMFCSKQKVVTESGLSARVEKEIANASGCVDTQVSTVIKSVLDACIHFQDYVPTDRNRIKANRQSLRYHAANTDRIRVYAERTSRILKLAWQRKLGELWNVAIARSLVAFTHHLPCLLT